jgi:hypothetical protein
LVETRKLTDSVVPAVSANALVEFVLGEEVEELSKKNASRVHGFRLSTPVWKEVAMRRGAN